MNLEEINNKIDKFVLKKRNFKFHLLMTLFTFGIWCPFYFAIKFCYLYKNKSKKVKKNEYLKFKKQQIIDKMDYGTVQFFIKEGKFRTKYKRYLVQVTSHGGCCELCKKWENLVLIDDLFSNGKPDNKHVLLSQAIKQGLFHNGCKHGLTTYYPELEDIENETEEGYKADCDYINKKLLEKLYKK